VVAATIKKITILNVMVKTGTAWKEKEEQMKN
jgi:hypothetical protein